MSSGDKGKVVSVVELFGDIFSEGISSTSRGNTPSASVIRVGPEQIAHGPFMGDFLVPVKLSYLIQAVKTGGESAVETEDLAFNYGSEGEQVEEISEVLPHIGVAVLAEAFIVEAIDLGDLSGLVVAS